MNSLRKLKERKDVSKEATLVTVDVVGLYPCMSYDVGLEVLRRTFDDWVNKKNDTEDHIKMSEFVLKK